MKSREDFRITAMTSPRASEETPTENPFLVGLGVIAAMLVVGNLTMLFDKDAGHEQETERSIQQYSVQKTAVPQDLYKLDDGSYKVKVEGKDCTANVVSRGHMPKAVTLDCK